MVMEDYLLGFKISNPSTGYNLDGHFSHRFAAKIVLLS